MKVYKSIYRSFSFALNVNGVRKRVEFEDKGKPYCYGVAYVFDEDLADAIEHCDYYGDIITLLHDDTPKKEEPAHIFAAEFPEVKRTQEANKILVNEYGVDKETLNSKEDAKAAALRLNINFPNL